MIPCFTSSSAMSKNQSNSSSAAHTPSSSAAFALPDPVLVFPSLLPFFSSLLSVDFFGLRQKRLMCPFFPQFQHSMLGFFDFPLPLDFEASPASTSLSLSLALPEPCRCNRCARCLSDSSISIDKRSSGVIVFIDVTCAATS